MHRHENIASKSSHLSSVVYIKVPTLAVSGRILESVAPSTNSGTVRDFLYRSYAQRKIHRVS
jgi:hypothetical protein